MMEAIQTNGDEYLYTYDQWAKLLPLHRPDETFIFRDWMKDVKGYMLHPAEIKQGMPVLARYRTMRYEDQILEYETVSDIYLYYVAENDADASFVIRYGKLE